MRIIQFLIQWLVAILMIIQLVSTNVSYATAKQTFAIAYLTQQQSPPPTLSNLDVFIPNKGIVGAELAIADNNTTGKFIHQHFELNSFVVPLTGDILDVFQKKIAGKFYALVVNLPAKQLQTLADHPAAQSLLLFDVHTIDDVLRNEQCRANVLHILPSRAMRADALAQYMVKQRWKRWFLVIGTTAEDKLFGEALHRAAKKFGINIVQEKTWEHNFEARRTAQSEVSVFTQVDDYDVLVVADEPNLFGDYLDYRTWLPRPVIGTQGLIATAWHKTHEQWGATQIQHRFLKTANRWAEEQDYAAYLAVRAIGDAVTRTQITDAITLKHYLFSDKFTLQGYKGNPLSFRAWDGQLRQPILLAAPRSMVAVAPIEGFLHAKTELDTLGYDQPESLCKAR